MSGAEVDIYEGMKTTHSLYFCLYKIYVVKKQLVDVENEAHSISVEND